MAVIQAMRKEVPAGVLEMLDVPGLSPEKVMKLYKELGITSLAALEAAAKADRLKGVKGLGPALQAKILQGIAIGREAEGKRHLHRAAALLRTAEQQLRQAHPNLKRITPAGEFRRGCELVLDLSLVVEASGADAGTMRSGSHLHIHLTDPAHYGIAAAFDRIGYSSRGTVPQPECRRLFQAPSCGPCSQAPPAAAAIDHGPITITTA